MVFLLDFTCHVVLGKGVHYPLFIFTRYSHLIFLIVVRISIADKQVLISQLADDTTLLILAKAEGLSRLTYTALSLNVDTAILKKIDTMLLNFVWKNKTHFIRKSVLMNTIEKGGLNFLDFTTLNNTFKIHWIKNSINKPSSIWNLIPNVVFSKLGGLSFLLICNYNIMKIPVKLSLFHRQMLLAWSLIFKHNFYTSFVSNLEWLESTV